MRALKVTVITTAIVLASLTVAHALDDPTARPTVASAGCGSSEIEPGRHGGSELIDGQEYGWEMLVPGAYDGVTPLPLWVQLHGCCGGTGLEQILWLRRAAEEHHFVVVAPEASIGKAGWTWREGDTDVDASLSNPDIGFIDGLLDRLGEDLCLDLARVYAAGYSAGGEGVSVLGCVMEDRIAAIGPVAGLLDLGEGCELDRPVPVLAVHGTADGILPFDGGFGDWGRPELPVVADASIPDRLAAMALRNGCGPDLSVENVTDGVEAWAEGVERWTWACPPGAEAGLLVHGGGHGWLHAGSVGFDGTALMWQFFEQHPMPD